VEGEDEDTVTHNNDVGGGRESEESEDETTAQPPTKALEIYTELILTLLSPTTTTDVTTSSPNAAAFDGFGSSSSTRNGRSTSRSITETNTPQQQSTTTTTRRSEEANSLLLKAFLVFQEMKASGSDPDLACYNALLQACAQAGDTDHLFDVMRRIQGDGFHPNAKSWREMLRGAAKARRSDVAEEVWEKALRYGGDSISDSSRWGHRFTQRHHHHGGEEHWIPNVDAFEALISAYIRQASVVKVNDKEASIALLVKAIQAYMEVVEGGRDDDNNDSSGTTCKGLHHIDVNLLRKNLRVMTMILKAVTAVERSVEQSILLHDDGGDHVGGKDNTFSFPYSQKELRAIMATISIDNNVT